MPQTSISNMAAAFPGMLEGYGEHAKRSFHNDLGSAAHTVDFTIDTASDDTAYQFEINGIPVAITSAASGATLASIRDQLIERMRAIPELEDIAFANPAGAAVVRVTGKTPGTPIVPTENDGNITLTTVQANVASAEIPFGRAVCKRTGGDDRSAHLPPAAVPQITDVTIVDQGAGAALNDTLYGFQIRIPGLGVWVIEALSDGSATVAEVQDLLVARVNALPVPVTASESAALVRLTSDVAGQPFFVEEVQAGLTVATSTANVTPRFLGVAERVHSVVDPATPGEGVGRGLAFPVVHRGAVWVETEVPVTEDAAVFFRHTANGALTKVGAFRTDSDSGNAIEVPASIAKWRRDSATGVGLLEINLP